LYLTFEKTRESKSIDKQIDRLIRGNAEANKAALESQNNTSSNSKTLLKIRQSGKAPFLPQELTPESKLC
jgi:hypothetical protein